MKQKMYEKYVERILYQRNIFSFLCLILSVSIFVLSFFLFLKRERVIVAPAVIEKEFWVEGNYVSSTYLEQFGLFLGQLLLEKSIGSAPMQRQILLRHASSNFSANLTKKLIEEEEILKKQTLSYVFFPIEIEVFPKHLKVRE